MQYQSQHDGRRAEARDDRGSEIDQLHQELARLRDALNLQDDFVAMLGHQLRNPLAPIVLAVELLQRQLAENPESLSADELQQRLRLLADGLQRFMDLLDRVFDMSSIRSGRLELHPEWVDLAQEVEDWLERHDGELHAADCELSCEIDHGVVGHWDRARIDQIVDSLLANALRYGSGHPIEVSVDRDGDDAILVVQDHGVGIPRTEQARVFERYARGSCGRRASGLGIGLWLVDELCRAMGGDVSLDSELGQGATFRVRLPLARDA